MREIEYLRIGDSVLPEALLEALREKKVHDPVKLAGRKEAYGRIEKPEMVQIKDGCGLEKLTLSLKNHPSRRVYRRTGRFLND